MIAATTAALTKNNLFHQNVEDITQQPTEFRLSHLLQYNLRFESTDFVLDSLKSKDDPTSLYYLQEEHEKKEEQYVHLLLNIQRNMHERAIATQKMLEEMTPSHRTPTPIHHQELARPAVAHKVAPVKEKPHPSIKSEFAKVSSNVGNFIGEGIENTKAALSTASAVVVDGAKTIYHGAEKLVVTGAHKVSETAGDIADGVSKRFNSASHAVATSAPVKMIGDGWNNATSAVTGFFHPAPAPKPH